MFDIRAATDDDLPRLREVFVRASLSNASDRAVLLAHPEDLEFPASSLAEGRVRVATLETAGVVGFAITTIVDGDLELVDLFTDPDRMRQGVGRSLISDLETHARSIGAVRVNVTANPNAVPFYEKVGFVAEGMVATKHGPGLRMHLPTDQ